jgi:hypothetical protein
VQLWSGKPSPRQRSEHGAGALGGGGVSAGVRIVRDTGARARAGD